MDGRPAGDEAGSRCGQQIRQIEGLFCVSIGAGGTARPARSCRSELPAGHPVVEIVDAYDLEVDVSASGVDEVIAADGR